MRVSSQTSNNMKQKSEVPFKPLASAEECIICGAPLIYLEHPTEMECAICHRKFTNNVRCGQGHYVCDECHTAGIDSIIGICMRETSCNPIDIIEKSDVVANMPHAWPGTSYYGWSIAHCCI